MRIVSGVSLLTRGDGVAKEIRRAEALFEAACKAGDWNGCINRAQRYMDGDSEKELVVAADLFRRACDAGGMVGCLELGLAHRYGGGVKQDAKLAAQLVARACSGGFFTACSLGAAPLRRAEIS